MKSMNGAGIILFECPKNVMIISFVIAIMCFAFGCFTGTVAGVIVIVFEQTRKE